MSFHTANLCEVYKEPDQETNEEFDQKIEDILKQKEE